MSVFAENQKENYKNKILRLDLGFFLLKYEKSEF